MSGNSTIRARLARATRDLRHLPPAWRLVSQAAGGWTALWALLLVVQGLLPLALVLLLKRLVDSAATLAATGSLGWPQAVPVLVNAVLIGVVLLAQESLRALSAYVRQAQALRVQDHISGLIHRKSLEMEMSFYDTPDFYDRLYRARDDAADRPLALVEGLGTLAQNAVTFLAMAAVLAQFGVWPLAALLGAVVPILFVVVRAALREFRWRVANTERERRTHYYDWLMTTYVAAAELRQLGVGDRFRQAFQSIRSELRQGRMGLARRQLIAELAARSLALLLTAAAVGWMAMRALRGEVSLGEVAMFYQAFSLAGGVGRAMLESAGNVHRSSLFLGDLFDFLALTPSMPPGGAAPPTFAPVEIAFRGVHFAYPGTGREVLRGLDLVLPAGRITAVVGPNGSGKTTLVKLLCRFYDPQCGEITWNGQPLTALDAGSLRQQIAASFQEPVRFAETAAGNIRLSDAASARGLSAVAEAAGADAVVQRLPHGYDTLLSRWFTDGVELSVGEWQRLGLARAFYREAPLLVLDEPTSAMDPWAESQWGARLQQVARGRTTLLITHRFSTARFADRIYVLDDGRVAESGTHEELLARRGMYARGWQR